MVRLPRLYRSQSEPARDSLLLRCAPHSPGGGRETGALGFRTVAHRYGLSVDQMSKDGANAVQAAERHRARTLIYRDRTPVAALVPIADVEQFEPPDPGASGSDPLLSLCGACRDDMFVDSLISDLGKTALFRRK